MAGKRGNGEGSLRKRANGTWEARYTGTNGKRESIYGTTRQEASNLLTAALREQHQHGTVTVQDGNVTLGAYLPDWLQRHSPRIDANTVLRYQNLITHVTSILGKVKLSKLTPQDVERLYAKKLETLSPSTVRKIHLCLHLALEYALRERLIVRNVCDLAAAPRVPKSRFDVWSEAEANRFLQAARGERLEALYVMALNVAMRQGELFALKWRDVDLDAGALYLSGSQRRLPRIGRQIKQPKTHTSRRRIRLPAPAVEALRRHKARQDEERAILRDAWEDNDLVFANGVGRGLERQNLEPKNYYPLIERAGVPRIRFHDLRHTAATLLLRRGVHPKIVSEMLGHASIAITLDLYSHFLPDMQEQAVSAMDSIFGSGVGNASWGTSWGTDEDDGQAQKE